MNKRTLFLVCLLAGTLFSLAATRRPARPILPAILTNLVLNHVVDAGAIDPGGSALEVSSYLEFQVDAGLAPGDEIRLATHLVKPTTAEAVTVTEIWTSSNIECQIDGSMVVCAVASTPLNLINPGMTVGYTVSTDACTVDGFLQQTATYTLDGFTGDLMSTWSGVDRIPCFTKKR